MLELKAPAVPALVEVSKLLFETTPPLLERLRFAVAAENTC